MKRLSHVAASLLCLLFITFGLNFFLKFLPMPPAPPEGTPPALFMAALFPTGYLAFVKCLEILGGLLVLIPRTRNLGLLVLGPIIVNILAFHVFLRRGAGLFEPPILLISGLSVFLLYAGRSQFAALLSSSAPKERE